LTLAAGGAEAPRSSLALPALGGELRGTIQSLKAGAAPPVSWVLAFDPRDDTRRRATFTAEGEGTRIQAEVELDAEGTGTWRITESRIELQHWLGPQISHGTAALTGSGKLERLVVTGDFWLKVAKAELGEILTLADPEKKYVRMAKGQVEGTIGVRVRAGKIGAGDSGLRLVPGTVATIAFAPSPGLLTDYVPAQVLKAYPGIAAIEMGQTPLEAKVLSLVFRPEGDEAGRGARIRIEGRPLDPKIIAPIELDLNFTGPLEAVVRKAMDSRLRIGK
jgi:hypothetical protein